PTGGCSTAKIGPCQPTVGQPWLNRRSSSFNDIMVRFLGHGVRFVAANVLGGKEVFLGDVVKQRGFKGGIISRVLLIATLAFGTISLPSRTAQAACGGISLTTLGAAYTQNFGTHSNVAGSTTNNLTITGWFLTESGGGARDNEQYAVDTGG